MPSLAVRGLCSVKENNLARGGQMEYIRVLELDKGDRNLEHADHYYDAAQVPQPMHLPISF